MRFLICGVGSIGQRHYRNLAALGQEVAFLRSGASNRYHQSFVEKFLEGEKQKGRDVQMFFSLEEALKTFRPEAALVCTPNSSHLATILPLVKAGLHCFVEKPVSHSMEGVLELADLVKKRKLKVAVGYNLRFHPLLREMKRLYDGGRIGKVLSARVDLGESIEDWHPWEDYRKTYAPYKSGGGGAVLCFSHDLDYLYWILGSPKKILAVGGKITPLEGDAEDMVEAVFEYEGGHIASVHLDYWQRPPVRNFELRGTLGKLVWDYYAKTLVFVDHALGKSSEVMTDPPGFERNTMFVDELQDFISAIKEDREPVVTLGDGVEVLKIAESIKGKITNEDRP